MSSLDQQIQDKQLEIDVLRSNIANAEQDENLKEIIQDLQDNLQKLQIDLEGLKKKQQTSLQSSLAGSTGEPNTSNSGSKEPAQIQESKEQSRFQIKELKPEDVQVKDKKEGDDADDTGDNSSDSDLWNANYDFGEEDDDIPVLNTELNWNRREENKDPQFSHPRNLYYGEINTIDDCNLLQFTEKGWQAKHCLPENNAIFMQSVMVDIPNHIIQQQTPTSWKVNNTVTLELLVGNVLEMDGTVVGQLCEQKPTPEIAHLLPTFDADLAKIQEKLGDDPIYDGGVIPCATKSTLPKADKFMVVQSSKEPNLSAGICSVLNILDCAEIMKAGTVSIPPLASFGSDEELAEHTVYHTVEFLHTIKDTNKLERVRLVAKDEGQMEMMANVMKKIIETRS